MDPVAEQVGRLVLALSRPDAYPFGVDEVTLVETHISLLFFAGERVYKVKKPVRFPFVDYSTRERRRHYCGEEVRLNARLAPGVYRGVVPIARDRSGALRIGAGGEPVDFAVEMVRLPAEGMMDRLLERGELDNALLRSLAERLATFHEAAPTGPGIDEHAQPAALRRTLDENLAAIGPRAPPAILARLSRELLGFVTREEAMLRARIAAHRIRDGHGDLHAGNVAVTPQGLVIYDCIEFSDRLRCGDVAAEIAFLAMDLDRRGLPAHAAYLCRAYAERADDPGMAALLPFYKSCRALVRAVVAGLRPGDAARRDGQEYLHLALGYHLPPALVCIGGLPGTGKSTIARAVARPLRAGLHRSDVVRKQLLGLPLTDRWGGGYAEGPYREETTLRTYARLRELAEADLAAGRSAVLDATFSKSAERAAARALAAGRGVPFVLALVETPEETVVERLRRRASDAQEASDAGVDVYRRARAGFDAPAAGVLRLDGLFEPGDSASRLLHQLA